MRIGAIDFDVIWEDQAWSRAASSCAQFDGEKFTIRVWQEGPERALACRFVHEVIHGLCWQHLVSKEPHTEEEVCNLASYELADFWRSNPEAFDWWIGAMKDA